MKKYHGYIPPDLIPCFCGSGKPAVDCCFRQRGGASQASGDALSRLNQKAQQAVEAYNHSPQEELQGLSPDQMRRLLHQPFDSPGLLKWLRPAMEVSDASVLQQFEALAEELSGEKGLKTTAKGNLPRAAVRRVAQRLYGDDYKERFYGDFQSEEDFFVLFHTRNAAQNCGLVRKTQGRLYLTKKAEKLLRANDWGAIHDLMLRIHCQKFNWSYATSRDVPIVQKAFAFSLRMLQRFGSERREECFYSDRFLVAFPMALDDLVDYPSISREKDFQWHYGMVTWHRFAKDFGLARLETEGKYPDQRNMIEKTELLDRVVQFHV